MATLKYKDGEGNIKVIHGLKIAVAEDVFHDVPDYHYAEVGRVAKKLLELKEQYPNNIVFGTIADNHVDLSNESVKKSAKHGAFALKNVGIFSRCDFIANLADNVSGTNIDNDTDLANLKYVEKLTQYNTDLIPFFNLVGNHEKSSSTQKLYDLIGKYNSFDEYGLTKIRGYGYKDFTSKKVRVIVLNTCDYWNTSGGNGMSYEQKDFFMKALDLSAKNDYASWTIAVLSHIPLDFLGGDYNKGADLKAILKAYNDGTTASITVNSNYANAQNEADRYSGTLTYNYAGKNAPRIINIHGHIHTNKYGKLKFIDDNTELDIVRVSTPNSSFNGNCSTDRYTEYGDYSITATEASKIKKVVGTKADTSATFYFIDLDSQIIYSIGYGADIDRELYYAYKGDTTYYTITRNLTNCTSNKTNTLAGEYAYITETYTADSGYTLDGADVSLTMGGQELVVGSYYSKGELCIDILTGDLVITIAAKKIEVDYPFDNLFDPSDADFQDGYILRSNGETKEGDGFVSGYIPCSYGDVIRVYKPDGGWSNFTAPVICGYKSDKTFSNDALYTGNLTITNNGTVVSWTVGSNVGQNGFVRVCGNGDANVFAVTKNEEITI